MAGAPGFVMKDRTASMAHPWLGIRGCCSSAQGQCLSSGAGAAAVSREQGGKKPICVPMECRGREGATPQHPDSIPLCPCSRLLCSAALPALLLPSAPICAPDGAGMALPMRNVPFSVHTGMVLCQPSRFPHSGPLSASHSSP